MDITRLSAVDASTRLRAALTAGTEGSAEFVGPLLDRCRVEPDFYVRDMLTWALCRLPVDAVVPRLVEELTAGGAQARSQALHTLSKIGDRRAWPVVSTFLHDGDDEVARSSWRAAVALVPDGCEGALAVDLARDLGRGDRERQLSLSRALVALGDAVLPVLESAAASRGLLVRAHALATTALYRDPEGGFDLSIALAQRAMLVGTEAAAEGDERC